MRVAHGLKLAPHLVFDEALRDGRCTAKVAGTRERPLPVRRWCGPVTGGDRFLLAHCVGPTIDLGCGPGRLAAELARRGIDVLGVDISQEAVRRTRARGIPAVQRDLFVALPREGRWGTALLADGNVGIGGDPAALLIRARALVAPGGRVVVEIGPPGIRMPVYEVSLAAGGHQSMPFPWAELGAGAVHAAAADAALEVREISDFRHRWVAVLTRPRPVGEGPC